MTGTQDHAPISKADDHRDPWAAYWATGALHSCASSFDGNYGGAIAAFWHAVFSTLAAGDRVLDVACGNGALGRLLVQQTPDASIGCDAVDLAPLSPRWLADAPPAQAKRIRFHPQTPAEQLPFEDGRFALAVSQYGIEYTDMEHSVAELLRVTRRPGRIALLLHHERSRPVSLARDEIAHLDWLFAEDGLLASVARIVPIVVRASTAQGRAALAHDPVAERERQRFNELQRELGTRAASALCPDVLYEVRDALGRVLALAGQAGAQHAAAALEALRGSLSDGRRRLADLCRCALDEQALQRLQARLGGHCRTDELVHSGWLMGYSLEVRVD